MKQKIFDKYVEKVCSTFNVKEELLFKKTKKQEAVDARYFLYYLCFNRPMKVGYIKTYMEGRGHPLNHSSIIYGIGVVSEKVDKDDDYRKLAKKLKDVV
tara:strand:- start:3416 stop:3712 length:297 start_codon:yes stop_codon:yes gene_type:complete